MDSIDYTLYYVTGRDLVPPDTEYPVHLEQAIRGGVSIVQVREKNLDTLEFLEIARAAQRVCKKNNIPLIINDRIDIALAIQADGVHLGQTDMPIDVARQLLQTLPHRAIIGVSCNTIDDARTAVEKGADYIGIGPVWATTTKVDAKNILGVRALGGILSECEKKNVPAVAIGGINATNALRTLHGAVSAEGRCLQGLAVVSDIACSLDPLASAQRLSHIVKAFAACGPDRFIGSSPVALSVNKDQLVDSAAALLERIRERTPLIHHITNNVVINQSANATLALGGSPIMATNPNEMEDLSRVIDALLINFGTIGDKEGMLKAGSWANRNRKPVVFDPVAIGATGFRLTSGAELLNAWQATVIKGNAGEIGALAKSNESLTRQVQSRGVDSVGSGFADPGAVVAGLALKERCIIALSGVRDWVSDGSTIVRLDNGHKLLGTITGSGCMLGTCIATFCAVANAHEFIDVEDGKIVRGDMLAATVGGILALTIASENAASQPDVKGPGTFLPALMDALYRLTPEDIRTKAKVEVYS